MPFAMPDYRRWHVPGGTFFFTLVTDHRRPILATDLARHCLREAIAKVRVKEDLKSRKRWGSLRSTHPTVLDPPYSSVHLILAGKDSALDKLGILGRGCR
jgi:hypothetical protein